MSPNRSERVGDRIRQELAKIIGEELRDPRVGFVTVTGVDLSPDLRHARVFVSVLGDEIDESVAALGRATPFLRRTLARRSGLRFTPELRFVADAAASTGFRVESLLREIGEQRSQEEEPSPPPEEAGDAD